jgi:hypothetical protein
MLTPEKSKLLLSFLSQLPETTAQRLAKAVEADRLAGGKTLPHETILGALSLPLRLLARIELHAGAIRSARHPFFDADALVEHLAQFTELSSHIALGIDEKWSAWLQASRAAVAETMEGFMERAPAEILATLAVQQNGRYGGGPICADLSRPADGESAERGRHYAKLLAGCAPYAAMGTFAAAQKEAMEAVGRYLRGYSGDIIREMRAPADERHPAVERQFELAARLTVLIFGPEEAEFLLRPARAAMNAQAAAAAA